MKARNRTILPEAPCTPILRALTCLLTILLLLTAGSCKKDKITKKPSQSGANALYFEAEGKEWRPTDDYMSFDASVEYLNDSLFHLVVSAESDQKRIQGKVKMQLFNIRNSGSYRCNDNISFLVYNRENLDDPSDGITCSGCLIKDETIHITRLDTTAKIISGTFSFVTRCNQNDSFLVEVKNGWFDYHYPYNN